MDVKIAQTDVICKFPFDYIKIKRRLKFWFINLFIEFLNFTKLKKLIYRFAHETIEKNNFMHATG